VTVDHIDVVGIVGAGTMGAGIAQVALEAGHEVVVYDVDAEAIAAGRARVRDGLERRARRDERVGADGERWVTERLERLRDVETVAGLAEESDLVIEAAIEVLDLKRDIFRALDDAAGADAILATNTSALSVASIAEAATRPDRILGLHFFNPAPVMPLVEVVAATTTAPSVAERAAAIVTGWGKTPVMSADSPGFIVNRVNRPFTIEALRILESGAAAITAIDDALRAAGFPMGPFELMDLSGIDVNIAAARAVWERLGRPARLRPSEIQGRLVAEGNLGRKTGQGFYVYDEHGRRTTAADAFAATADGGSTPGEIVERVRLAIANEAFFALGEEVADEDAIDLAMRLGAAHPEGPLAWARRRGLRNVVEQLEALVLIEGRRFAPAPVLVSEA